MARRGDGIYLRGATLQRQLEGLGTGPDDA
jgi:hypothetical protein